MDVRSLNLYKVRGEGSDEVRVRVRSQVSDGESRDAAQLLNPLRKVHKLKT